MELLYVELAIKRCTGVVGGWVLLLAIGSRRAEELFSFPSYGQ